MKVYPVKYLKFSSGGMNGSREKSHHILAGFDKSQKIGESYEPWVSFCYSRCSCEDSCSHRTVPARKKRV